MGYVWLMKTLLVATPERTLTQEDVNELFPEKPEGWQFEVGRRQMSTTGGGPEAIVVQVGDNSQPSQIKAVIHRVANLQTAAPSGSFVLFALKETGGVARRHARAQQERISAILEKINAGLQEFPNPDRVDVSLMQGGRELAAKLKLIEAKLRVSSPRPSSLDRAQKVIEATEDLRTTGGNLSAEAVAEAFGISTNQLAGWLGRSRQTVSKTPDAESLQDELEYFERVARLRAALPKPGFLKWLRMPNSELDGKKPLELLGNGERQAVADLVDDMLTGAPA
jgi:hypothetical protein